MGNSLAGSGIEKGNSLAGSIEKGNSLAGSSIEMCNSLAGNSIEMDNSLAGSSIERFMASIKSSGWLLSLFNKVVLLSLISWLQRYNLREASHFCLIQLNR